MGAVVGLVHALQRATALLDAHPEVGFAYGDVVRFRSEPPPARIVLLSDGENTAGRPPEIAAEEAAAAGVPVYTIAYGTSDGQVLSGGYVVPVPVDGPALERLADATGGRFYEAASGEELQAVYEDIGSSVGFRTERQERTGNLCSG